MGLPRDLSHLKCDKQEMGWQCWDSSGSPGWAGVNEAVVLTAVISLQVADLTFGKMLRLPFGTQQGFQLGSAQKLIQPLQLVASVNYFLL